MLTLVPALVGRSKSHLFDIFKFKKYKGGIYLYKIDGEFYYKTFGDRCIDRIQTNTISEMIEIIDKNLDENEDEDEE